MHLLPDLVVGGRQRDLLLAERELVGADCGDGDGARSDHGDGDRCRAPTAECGREHGRRKCGDADERSAREREQRECSGERRAQRDRGDRGERDEDAAGEE